MWDAATGRELISVEHPPGLQAVAFSPDGTQLATAGYDGITRLWDAASSTPRLVLDSQTTLANGVAFSREATCSPPVATMPWGTMGAQTGRRLLTRHGRTLAC